MYSINVSRPAEKEFRRKEDHSRVKAQNRDYLSVSASNPSLSPRLRKEKRKKRRRSDIKSKESERSRSDSRRRREHKD